MLERLTDGIIKYCLYVMCGFVTFAEEVPAVVAIGAPLLALAAVRWLLPSWVSALLAVTVVAPLAAGLAIVMAIGFSQSRR